MSKLDLDFGLTERCDQRFDAQLRLTHKGMAHFAGTGPNGETCRTCQHWDTSIVEYYAKSGKRGPTLKPQQCRRCQSLMGGVKTPAVPHDASACRHWEQDENPPKITDPKA